MRCIWLQNERNIHREWALPRQADCRRSEDEVESGAGEVSQDRRHRRNRKGEPQPLICTDNTDQKKPKTLPRIDADKRGSGNAEFFPTEIRTRTATCLRRRGKLTPITGSPDLLYIFFHVIHHGMQIVFF